MAGSRKPTLFLHIGTEKTGTSTIQNLFLRNYDAFKAMGVLYPKGPIMRVAAHRSLVLLAAGEADPKKIFRESGIKKNREFKTAFMDDLVDEVQRSGCDRILMSSEHLAASLRSGASVHRLATAMHAITDDIRIIIYIRPQHELFPSLYSTAVKAGRTEPCELPGRGAHNYNYDRILLRWETEFGRDKLHVRLFSRAEFKNGKLIDDFFDVLGIPVPDWITDESVKNPRLSAAALEFLRVSNCVSPIPSSRKVGEGVDFERHNLVRALENYPSKDKAPVVPIDMMRETERLFAKCNEAVAARYFPNRTKPLFPPFVAPQSTSPEGLTAEEAVEIAMHLWRNRTMALSKFRGKAKGVRAEAGQDGEAPDPMDEATPRPDPAARPRRPGVARPGKRNVA